MVRKLTLNPVGVFLALVWSTITPAWSVEEAGLEVEQKKARAVVKQAVQENWKSSTPTWYTSRWVARYSENDALWHEERIWRDLI